MPIPVLNVRQIREWEAATWAAGMTESDVIRRVGAALANRARSLTRPGEVILILAGRGHNGDDARAAVPLLGQHVVRLISVEEPAAASIILKEFLKERPALLIDALFGIGLSRPLAGPWIQLITEMNESLVPILAVDIPSGLDADSGRPQPVAVKATCTLTIGCPKNGMLAATAQDFVGSISVADDVGLIPCPMESALNWTAPGDFWDYPPARSPGDHKGVFGHAAIIAGSVGYHGAAVLAARGASRAGPGLVSVYTVPDAYVPVASQLQGAMVHVFSSPEKLPDHGTAILVGPGLAQADLSPGFEQAARQLWDRAHVPLVVDASALPWLPRGPRKSNAARVITPHPGEAARMLGMETGEVQRDRLNTALTLSKLYGDCFVVLKGSQTIVATPRGRIYVNPSGNPAMAQGGTGDVLAGYLAGLLAQPRLQGDPLRALRYGVWSHGLAADFLANTRKNWTVEELPNVLGNTDPLTLYPNFFSRPVR